MEKIEEIRTYWCVRLKSSQFKRTHVFCQFAGEFRLQYRQWLEDHLPKLQEKYGKDMIALRVTTAGGLNRPYNPNKD
jgi:hypothetical protein